MINLKIFQSIEFKNKRTCMHCKAKQVLRNLVSTNQENGSCVQELLKSTSLENLAIIGWLDAGNNMKVSLYSDGRFEPLGNFWKFFGEVLLELIS